MTTAKEIIEYMESLRNEEQRENLMRFFKTAPASEFFDVQVKSNLDR